MASVRTPPAAAILLAGAVILTPCLAGGWRLAALPLYAAPVAVAWGVLVAQRLGGGRSLSVPLVSLVLGGLAVFSAFQNAPLGDLLSLLSPRAAEVRAFVAPEQRMSVSYEVGATWREAAKMMVYALTAAAAHEIARRRGGRRLLLPVVVAGGASLGVALLHRVLQLDASWGAWEGQRPASELVTTFQNPNHASAFLTASTLVAIGLAIDAPGRAERTLMFGTAGVLAAASVVEPSKGGVLALGVGLFAFGLLLWRRGRGGNEAFGLPALFAAVLLPLAGVIWQLDEVFREFGVGDDAATLGLVEKLAAVRDAWPILRDHPWVGIGRGAYVSVYPHYQSSSLQLIFAFPENVLAQLTSEWGWIVGGAAVIGLGVLVVGRLLRADKPYEIGAASALLAVLVHDLVDFSLELPGVAVAYALMAGALAPRRRGIQLQLRGGAMAAGVALLPTALLVVTTYGAFRSGDLATDVAWLSAHAAQVAEGAPVEHDEVRRRAERHPANVHVAAQVAYLREVQSPPDLAGALRAINRALYLGPNYADGHLLAARLLLRAGHRRQAFEELRVAWDLTRGRQDLILTAAGWARSTEELIRAVPRSDRERDVLDVGQVARLTGVLIASGEMERARGLLSALPPVEALDEAGLAHVAHAALRAGLTDLALAAARRGAELEPGDAVLALTLARLAHRAGRLDEARRLAADIEGEGVDRAELLRLRVELALADGDYEEARSLLEDLRRAVPVTREHQTEVALQEAQIHLSERRPDRAVAVLSRAVDWSPANAQVRLARARALFDLGRRAEARIDLEFVLRRYPDHRAARSLLGRLKVSN